MNRRSLDHVSRHLAPASSDAILHASPWQQSRGFNKPGHTFGTDNSMAAHGESIMIVAIFTMFLGLLVNQEVDAKYIQGHIDTSRTREVCRDDSGLSAGNV